MEQLFIRTTSVIDPLNFSAQLGTENAFQEFDTFEERLSDLCTEKAETMKLERLTIGSVGYVNCENKWKRVEIVAVNTEISEVDVFYIDYGTEDSFPIARITECEAAIPLLVPPLFTYKCSLANIKPIAMTRKWASRAINIVTSYILDKFCPVSIIGFTIMGTYCVDITVQVDGVNKSLSEVLLDEDVALRDENVVPQLFTQSFQNEQIVSDFNEHAPTDSFVFSPVTSAAGDVEEQSFHTVEEMQNIDDRILSGNIEGLSHDTFERIYKQIDDVSLSPKSKKDHRAALAPRLKSASPEKRDNHHSKYERSQRHHSKEDGRTHVNKPRGDSTGRHISYNENYGVNNLSHDSRNPNDRQSSNHSHSYLGQKVYSGDKYTPANVKSKDNCAEAVRDGQNQPSNVIKSNVYQRSKDSTRPGKRTTNAPSHGPAFDLEKNSPVQQGRSAEKVGKKNKENVSNILKQSSTFPSDTRHHGDNARGLVIRDKQPKKVSGSVTTGANDSEEELLKIRSIEKSFLPAKSIKEVLPAVEEIITADGDFNNLIASITNDETLAYVFNYLLESFLTHQHEGQKCLSLILELLGKPNADKILSDTVLVKCESVIEVCYPNSDKTASLVSLLGSLYQISSDKLHNIQHLIMHIVEEWPLYNKKKSTLRMENEGACLKSFMKLYGKDIAKNNSPICYRIMKAVKRRFCMSETSRKLGDCLLDILILERNGWDSSLQAELTSLVKDETAISTNLSVTRNAFITNLQHQTSQTEVENGHLSTQTENYISQDCAVQTVNKTCIDTAVQTGPFILPAISQNNVKQTMSYNDHITGIVADFSALENDLKCCLPLKSNLCDILNEKSMQQSSEETAELNVNHNEHSSLDHTDLRDLHSQSILSPLQPLQPSSDSPVKLSLWDGSLQVCTNCGSTAHRLYECSMKKQFFHD